DADDGPSALAERHADEPGPAAEVDGQAAPGRSGARLDRAVQRGGVAAPVARVERRLVAEVERLVGAWKRVLGHRAAPRRASDAYSRTRAASIHCGKLRLKWIAPPSRVYTARRAIGRSLRPTAVVAH